MMAFKTMDSRKSPKQCLNIEQSKFNASSLCTLIKWCGKWKTSNSLELDLMTSPGITGKICYKNSLNLPRLNLPFNYFCSLIFFSYTSSIDFQKKKWICVTLHDSSITLWWPLGMLGNRRDGGWTCFLGEEPHNGVVRPSKEAKQATVGLHALGVFTSVCTNLINENSPGVLLVWGSNSPFRMW